MFIPKCLPNCREQGVRIQMHTHLNTYHCYLISIKHAYPKRIDRFDSYFIYTQSVRLESGERKSNRMFLWQNPGQNSTLKQILNGRPSVFSEKHVSHIIFYFFLIGDFVKVAEKQMTIYLYCIQQLEDLIKVVKSALSLDYTILRNVDFIIDVMVPEVCSNFC